MFMAVKLLLSVNLFFEHKNYAYTEAMFFKILSRYRE